MMKPFFFATLFVGLAINMPPASAMSANECVATSAALNKEAAALGKENVELNTEREALEAFGVEVDTAVETKNFSADHLQTATALEAEFTARQNAYNSRYAAFIEAAGEHTSKKQAFHKSCAAFLK